MKKKRIGRGNSSKMGNTSCRGYKGQKSRSGFSKKRFFIGGQTPLNILFPKYGFKKYKKNYFRKINFNFNKNIININKKNLKKVLFDLNFKFKSLFIKYKFSLKQKKNLMFKGSLIT
ncbi:50S ribosomal protein L15 [Candidatus Vidania fulgoroideorum]